MKPDLVLTKIFRQQVAETLLRSRSRGRGDLGKKSPPFSKSEVLSFIDFLSFTAPSLSPPLPLALNLNPKP